MMIKRLAPKPFGPGAEGLVGLHARFYTMYPIALSSRPNSGFLTLSSGLKIGRGPHKMAPAFPSRETG